MKNEYMYQTEVINRLFISQKTLLENIREDFKLNLRPKLEHFIGRPLISVMIYEIQNEIDYFLERNNLHIKVHVYRSEIGISIIGRTLIDNIVWETIQ